MSSTIEGQVTEITQSGNLVTDIANDLLVEVPHDESVSIRVGPHETIGIYGTDHQQPESTMIAISGNSGHLEICIVGMNTSEMLGINPGEKVLVCWPE